MEASSQRRGGHPVAGPVGGSARLLVVGDSHGNEFFLARAAKWAAKLGCELIVQLGDFGFWPDQRVKRDEGRAVINDKWLDAVARHLTQGDRNQRMLALDGNHDAHPLLRASHGAPDAHGFRPIRDRVLTHAERGAVWVWCGLRFGALGGAISIDRSMRRSGWEWWESEAITQAELDLLVERARQLGGLDVLFTHDAPSGIDIPLVRPVAEHRPDAEPFESDAITPSMGT